MRAGKQAEFERLRSEYRVLRDTRWQGDKRYDAWINAPMNNAKLLPFGLYDQWVPAFAALFREVGGDWAVFYQRVDRKDSPNYTVDHTAASYVYDPQGRLRLFERYGTPVADLAADIKRLIDGA